MHEIQSDILNKLMFSKKARYRDLKTKDVEGNLFSYHLQTLLKNEYILLKNSYYYLTTKGAQHVDRMSAETLKPRAQPKIATLLVLKSKGKYLLYKRGRMPFINHIGFPYGKIHLEERVSESANRELFEKTGLTAKLKHRGDVYITVHNETELVSHTLFHIFSGSKIQGQLSPSSQFGECFWGNIDKTAKTADDTVDMLIPGVIQIDRLLRENKSKFFFGEFFLNCSEEM
jgi:ADP-ribose pyrophosphatase YjhB (NUDIX family)